MKAGSPMALIAEFQAPLFSIKLYETYQVAVSYPLPPPSTIIGALAYSIGLLGYCKPDYKFGTSSDCYKKVAELVDKARAALPSPGERIGLSHRNTKGDLEYLMTKTGVILRRLRKVLEKKKLPRDYQGIVDFSDAMVREYSTLFKFKIVLIPSGIGRNKLDNLVKLMWLIERLGDSESLVSVTNVRVAPLVPCGDGNNFVNVVVKADVVSNGSYMVMKGFDEKYNEVNLAFPVVSYADHYRLGEIMVKNSVKPVYCAEDVRIPDPNREW